ncbi:MAG TPA: ATP-binding cassette domain-containing protein, partial [Ruminococcus bromii]|nr:ATP-binding cassette domain-containing protein [Ruminococcus bromii]
IKNLSKGYRQRVGLAQAVLGYPPIIILDEPTNHLDASSREELEKTLLDYSGTMLIVSHDRYFINKIADRILLLTNNGVKEYLGNYDYYLERTTAEKSGAVPTENKKDKKEKTQNDYFLQKQKQSEERKRQTKLKKA